VGLARSLYGHALECEKGGEIIEERWIDLIFHMNVSIY
jgi:hypothetical protein